MEIKTVLISEDLCHKLVYGNYVYLIMFSLMFSDRANLSPELYEKFRLGTYMDGMQWNEIQGMYENDVCGIDAINLAIILIRIEICH